jgi:hypothetical protein
MFVSRWIFGCCLNAAIASVPEVTGQPLPRVTVVCEPLDVEGTAEVEARVRAMLLTAQVSDPEVDIFCTAARADVDVKAGPAAAHVQISPERIDLEGRLLDAVDRALRELAEPKTEPQLPGSAKASAPPKSPIAPASVTPFASSSGSPTPSRRPVSGAAPRGATTSLEVSALASLERWSTGNAVGGNAGASYGSRAIRAAFALGVATLTHNDPAFQSRELHADLALIWQPAWTWGVRGSASVGGSLLSVTPNADFTPRSGTTATAAFAELALSRPFWLGSSWGFGPRVSARAFAARRSVTVNVKDALVLAGVAPSVGLELFYRLE